MTLLRESCTCWLVRFGTANSLLAKEGRGSVTSTVGFDQAIVAQDGDPGIPVAAARLFAEYDRELIGIHELLALGGQSAQHFRGRGRQAATPQGKPLGRCGRRRLP